MNELKILIVNDDKKVLSKIIEKMKNENRTILKAESYQETIKKIHENPDINKIILDITLPTYKIQKHDSGGTFRRNAGLKIMNWMKLYNIDIDVILVTRLGRFYDSNTNTRDDYSSIEDDIKKNKWCFCRGIVKFEDKVTLDWVNNLENFIKDKNE